MSISLQNPQGCRVAELREVKVHGSPGVGCYTLVLNLHFTPTQPKANANIRNLFIRLEWSDDSQRMIGTALPDSSLPIPISSFSTNVTISFRLPISSAQIEDIETRRNGGNFSLRMWFSAELDQDGEFKGISDLHVFTVRQQEWIEALEQMEYRRTLLFELPVPTSDSPIGELVRRAQTFLFKGDYDQAVALCRQAIEKIEAQLGDQSSASRAVEKYRTNRKEMDETERLLFLREALKHTTHSAVHHNDNHYGYSRNQAKAILGTTITLLGSAFSGEKIIT